MSAKYHDGGLAQFQPLAQDAKTESASAEGTLSDDFPMSTSHPKKRRISSNIYRLFDPFR